MKYIAITVILFVFYAVYSSFKTGTQFAPDFSQLAFEKVQLGEGSEDVIMKLGIPLRVIRLDETRHRMDEMAFADRSNCEFGYAMDYSMQVDPHDDWQAVSILFSAKHKVIEKQDIQMEE